MAIETTIVDGRGNVLGLTASPLITSAGSAMPAALGQAAMAASLPVVVASNQSTVPVSLAAAESTTVVEYNVTLTSANTQYSQALPANTRRLCFRCRSGVAIRYAWAAGKVATPTAPYQSLQAGSEYVLDGVLLAGSTLYFASGAAGAVVEMEAWS